jgi:hypothetical protein
LRYAPEIRFFKDNTMETLKTYEEERVKYSNEMNEEPEETPDLMSGPMASYARPLIGLLQYIKDFKRLS